MKQGQVASSLKIQLNLIEFDEDRFGEIYELDKNDFPSDGVIVKAYLPVNSFLIETMKDIEQSIGESCRVLVLMLGKTILKQAEVDDEDWATAWKKYYHPVKISGRFTIVPTWEEYEPVDSDELIIELDPGMAFGTGTHPTTVMCMQALEKYVQPRRYDCRCRNGFRCSFNWRGTAWCSESACT